MTPAEQAQDTAVQWELFEQSVRCDLLPCVPSDRLDIAVDQVVSNPHLRVLARMLAERQHDDQALFDTARVASQAQDRLEACRRELADAIADRQRLAAQVQGLTEVRDLAQRLRFEERAERDRTIADLAAQVERVRDLHSVNLPYLRDTGIQVCTGCSTRSTAVRYEDCRTLKALDGGEQR